MLPKADSLVIPCPQDWITKQGESEEVFTNQPSNSFSVDT